MSVHLSDLGGRTVLDVSTAKTVATVKHAVVDPASKRVTALSIDPVDGVAELLPWDAIKAIGRDAITVDSADVLRRASDDDERRRAGKGFDPIGKVLMGDDGTSGGVVTEIVIDEPTGAVEEIFTAEHFSKGSALIGTGDYAVVVARA